MQYVQPYVLCSFEEATANASHARGSSEGEEAALQEATVQAWPRGPDKRQPPGPALQDRQPPTAEVPFQGSVRELCRASGGSQLPGGSLAAGSSFGESPSASPPQSGRWLVRALSTFLRGRGVRPPPLGRALYCEVSASLTTVFQGRSFPFLFRKSNGSIKCE